MFSIKKLLLFAIVLGWFAVQPALAASNEFANGTEARQVSQSATILRVNDDSGAGSPDGSTWPNAYPKLQDALAAATSGDEIWVAAGIYYPDEGSGQTNDAQMSTFQLASGVAIYGGFNGTESARADRDWEANVTVLSGDIEQNDNNKDANGIISSTDDIVDSNAYHVVTGSGTDSTAILDGFTINAGQANGVNPENAGAGIYNNGGSPTLSNLKITSNSATFGGGMLNKTSSSPTLTNVTISGNSASANAGGMLNESSSHPTLTNVTLSSNIAINAGGGIINNITSHPTLTKVTISDNSATLGGGMFNDNLSSPTLNNVTISGNSASSAGGGVMNNNSSHITLTNVLISDNSAQYGGGMFNQNSSNPTLTNVTISGNAASINAGGMLNEGSSHPTLSNVIIWNNQASSSTTSTSASIVNNSGTATISYSLIANSGGSGGGWPFGTDDGNNIDADPKFVTDGSPSTTPPTAGDYRLQLDSPAIDAGNNNADLDGAGAGTTTIGDITTDLDGKPRLWDVPVVADSGNGTAPIVDMGAYEARLLHVYEDSMAASPDGSTWANAYPKLQDALAVATSGDEIWVAAGIYYPDERSGQADGDQTSSFQLKNSVPIYGGFDRMETARADRDWEANVTVLSGDIEQNDTNKDANGIISSTTDIVGNNANHVVTGSGTNSSAILDGFTINAGQANGGNPHHTGGALYNDGGSPTLSNVTISSNSATFGGGIFNISSSSPTLSNVTISGNSALTNGGGMFNQDSSSPTLTDVTLSDNSASNGGGGVLNFISSSPTLTDVIMSGNSATLGGGMFNLSSSNPTLTNVTISGNSASNSGGGVFNEDSSNPVLTNVTLSSNSATNFGGGILNKSSSHPTLTNVIIWNNEASGSTASTSASIVNDSSTATISYSLIANSGGSGGGWQSALGTDGGNNINGDPKFVTAGDPSTTPPTVGDYRLQKDSAAIDMGKIESCPDKDIRGEARDDLACDIGAYEFTGSDGMDVTQEIAGTGTYTFGPTLVAVEVANDGGGCLTALNVEEVTTSHPQAPEGIQTGKYWNISPTGCTTGFSVNLTLPHTDTITAADARACRYDGSTWDCGDSGNNGSTNNRVTRNGVGEFSPWAVGNASLPLAVNLASFTADASVDEIRLEWATVSEQENLGFNLYRATSPEGSFGQTQLNSELIPSQAPGSGTGAAYEWLDSNVEADTTYYYWLEDVDIHGTSTMHGPVSATPSNTTAVSLQELRSHQSRSSMWLLLVGVLGVMGLVAWRRL